MELIKVKDNEIELAEKVVTDLKNFKKLKVKMELVEKQLREELLEAMEEHNITNWQKDGITVTYKKPCVRTSIDSTRLKKELPDIAEEYSKTTNVKASVELDIEV